MDKLYKYHNRKLKGVLNKTKKNWKELKLAKKMYIWYLQKGLKGTEKVLKEIKKASDCLMFYASKIKMSESRFEMIMSIFLF